jgi:hypothetical protein
VPDADGTKTAGKLLAFAPSIEPVDADTVLLLANY